MADAAAREFANRFGGPPAVIASAPGRVNLIGGHVDYNDGIVLPLAIDRYTLVAATPTQSPLARVYSQQFQQSFEFDWRSPDHAAPHIAW